MRRSRDRIAERISVRQIIVLYLRFCIYMSATDVHDSAKPVKRLFCVG